MPNTVWPKSAVASHPHHTPIHLIQHMARTPSEEPKPATTTITDDQAKELKKLDTILQISTSLGTRELRDKFRQMVVDEQTTRARAYAQVRTFNLDHPMARATESVQCAKLLEEKTERDNEMEEAEVVLESLKHEVS